MYQKLIFGCHLGQDPEMRYMPDGTAVANFSVASNRRWTDNATGQPRDETTWFRVSVWRKQAETVNQYLSTGSKVLIEGRLRPDPASGNPRTFTRHDGTVGASYEVTADVVRFLSSREENGSSAAASEYIAESAPVAEEDDIPF